VSKPIFRKKAAFSFLCELISTVAAFGQSGDLHAGNYKTKKGTAGLPFPFLFYNNSPFI
jgi:hypothetical protein